MKYPFVIKGSVLGLLLSACAITASAQKIEEQQLKVDVEKITNPVNRLNNLEPITFKYDVQKFSSLDLPNGQQYGFIASNVLPQFPEMVYEASKMYSSGKNNSKVAKYSEVQQENLIPVLVAAVKEQQAQIEALKKELDFLKSKLK